MPTAAAPQNSPGTAGANADAASPFPVVSPPDPNVQNQNTAASPTTVFNCDNANFPVCDGFETVADAAQPDPNRWNNQVAQPPPDDASVHSDDPNHNYMKVTSAKAHRGKQSLLIHTVAGAEHLVVQDVTSATFPKAFLPAPNNIFYVRYWIYDNGAGGDLTQIPVGSSHFYVVNASGPLAGRQQYEKFGGGDGPAGPAGLSWNYYGNDAILNDSTPWPMGVWTCFEVEFKGDTGELNAWMNDQTLPAMHSAPGSWVPPAYNRLTLGWEMDHPPSTFAGSDVYLDDVAYSYARIGCAP